MPPIRVALALLAATLSPVHAWAGCAAVFKESKIFEDRYINVTEKDIAWGRLECSQDCLKVTVGPQEAKIPVEGAATHCYETPADWDEKAQQAVLGKVVEWKGTACGKEFTQKSKFYDAFMTIGRLCAAAAPPAPKP